MEFKKAVKREAKGRAALIGPAGSGKSFTMLTLARALAGPTGKIAAIDTEHGSLSKYAHTDACGGAGTCAEKDHFEFDVLELDSFTPENFQEALKAAEKNGYTVFCCDSLSHFWTGKNGALEFVDMRNKVQRDQMGGWKDWRPHERAMVDAMIASPCHIITTMRTKTDYQESVGQDGKKKRTKVGLAPVQREGLEYEFDLVGYMDDENTLIIDKTRCSHYARSAYVCPTAKTFEPFIEWLKGAPAEAPSDAIEPSPATAETKTASNGTVTVGTETKNGHAMTTIEFVPADVVKLRPSVGKEYYVIKTPEGLALETLTDPYAIAARDAKQTKTRIRVTYMTVNDKNHIRGFEVLRAAEGVAA